jgi:hypothetical protein
LQLFFGKKVGHQQTKTLSMNFVQVMSFEKLTHGMTGARHPGCTKKISKNIKYL